MPCIVCWEVNIGSAIHIGEKCVTGYNARVARNRHDSIAALDCSVSRASEVTSSWMLFLYPYCFQISLYRPSQQKEQLLFIC